MGRRGTGVDRVDREGMWLVSRLEIWEGCKVAVEKSGIEIGTDAELARLNEAQKES